MKRPFKVIDFGTKLPIESAYSTSYYSSIVTLPRFRDIACFLRRATSPLFHQNFGGIPLGLDCRCCGSDELIIRVITFELTQHLHSRYINVTDEQTDGRLTIAIPCNAHSVSRGENCDPGQYTLTFPLFKTDRSPCVGALSESSLV